MDRMQLDFEAQYGIKNRLVKHANGVYVDPSVCTAYMWFCQGYSAKPVESKKPDSKKVAIEPALKVQKAKKRKKSVDKIRTPKQTSAGVIYKLLNKTSRGVIVSDPDVSLKVGRYLEISPMMYDVFFKNNEGKFNYYIRRKVLYIIPTKAGVYTMKALKDRGTYGVTCLPVELASFVRSSKLPVSTHTFMYQKRAGTVLLLCFPLKECLRKNPIPRKLEGTPHKKNMMVPCCRVNPVGDRNAETQADFVFGIDNSINRCKTLARDNTLLKEPKLPKVQDQAPDTVGLADAVN